MTPEIFQDAFQQNVVRFTFKKLDGTVREAVGTTNPNMIENLGGKNPKSEFNPNSKSFSFFDTEKKEWRSVSKDNLASIEIQQMDRL